MSENKGVRSLRPVRLALLVFALVSCSFGGVVPTAAAPTDGEALQNEMLEDGVTAAEYERAVLAVKACMLEQFPPQVSVEGPVLDVDGVRLVLSFGWNAGDDSALDAELTDRTAAVALECSSEFADRVEAEFLRANQPSQAAAQEDAEALLECLRTAGFAEIDDTWSGSKIGQTVSDADLALNEAGGRCIVAHQIGMNRLRQKDQPSDQ